ncbi:hypothetical protein EJB05_50256, partial [Eragrostis curvula]
MQSAGVTRRVPSSSVRAPSSSAGWGPWRRVPSSPVRAPSPSVSWGRIPSSPVRDPSASAGWDRIPSSPVPAPSPSAGSWGCPTPSSALLAPNSWGHWPSSILVPSRSPDQTPPVQSLSPSLVSMTIGRTNQNHDDTATKATTNHNEEENMATIKHVDAATTKHDVLFNNKTIYTTVTKSVDAVERFIEEVRGDHREHLLVGLDTEWHRYRSIYSRSGYGNKTAIVQICVGDRCLIFQIYHADRTPWVLKEFLGCPHCKFVRADVQQDVRRLALDFGFRVCNPVDLQPIGIRLGYGSEERQPSLKVLVKGLLRADMDKDKELHKTWARETLTLKHISYAAIDAYASLEVAKAMDVKVDVV